MHRNEKIALKQVVCERFDEMLNLAKSPVLLYRRFSCAEMQEGTATKGSESRHFH